MMSSAEELEEAMRSRPPIRSSIAGPLVLLALLLLGATLACGQEATTIAVSCDPTTVLVNEGTTCTVLVTNTEGSDPPTGTVTLTASPPNGGFAPGFPLDLAGGTVQSNTVSIDVVYTPDAAMSPGLEATHAISGSYTPSGDFSESSTAAPAALTVQPRPTDTTVVPSQPSVLVNVPVDLTVTVAEEPALPGIPAVPTGTLTVTAPDGVFDASGTDTVVVTLTEPDAGSVVLTYTPAADGDVPSECSPHPIEAEYAGSDVHGASSGSTDPDGTDPTLADFEVCKRRTSTTVTGFTPVAVFVGQPLEITAIITDIEGDGFEVLPTGDPNGFSFSSTGSNTWSVLDWGPNPLDPDISTELTIGYVPTGAISDTTTHTISGITYNEDLVHLSSTESTIYEVIVNRRHVGVTADCVPGSVHVGQPAEVTITVTDITTEGDPVEVSGLVRFASSMAGQFSDLVTGDVITEWLVDAAGQYTVIYTPLGVPDPADPTHPVHTLEFTYDGSDAHQSSLGTVGLTVLPHDITMSVECTPTSVYIDQTTTITVTAEDLTPEADPVDLTGHTVTFDDLGKAGTFSSDTASLSEGAPGVFSCSATYTPAPGDGGTTTVRATLEPSGLHGTTITDASLTVMRRQTTTTISLGASDVFVDKPVTVTVTVTDVTPGASIPSVTPQGVVQLSTPDNGEFAPTFCTPTQKSLGCAECTSQYTPRGATGESLSGHSLLANYYDTGVPASSELVRHAESDDNVTLSVKKRPTVISLSVVGVGGADPKNAEMGDQFTITATISDNLPGAPAGRPTGYVYFYDASKVVPESGNFFDFRLLTAGTGETNSCSVTFTIGADDETPFHLIQAKYAGDERFQLSGGVYDTDAEKPGIFSAPMFTEDDFEEPDPPPVPPPGGMSAPGGVAPTLHDDCGCGKKSILAVPWTKIMTAYNLATTIVEASKIGVETPPDPLVDATDPVEAAFDAVLMVLKADFDGDGWVTALEMVMGLDPLTPDTDADGIKEPDEVTCAGGWLGDTWPNPWMEDSDGDGLKDGDELANYQTDYCCPDTDHDGVGDGDELSRRDAALQHQSDPLRADTDSDGIGDWFEFAMSSPFVNDADSDDDGLQDGAEDNGGDPIRGYISTVDSIGDYVSSDAYIVYYNVDRGSRMTPGDHTSQCVGETHFSLADTDGDGLQDGEEAGLFGLAVEPEWVPMRGEPGMTVPALDSDIDNDGLTDSEELYIYQTDPTDQDTDGDSLYDGLEVATWDEAIALRLMALGYETQNWFKKGGVVPNNPGDHASPLNADTDGDGFGDELEYFLGCNCGLEGFGSRDGFVNNPDSDNDQLPDKLDAEQLIPPGPDGNPREPGSDVALAYGNNGELEPDGPDTVCAVCDPDSDNDGLPDGLELSLGTKSTDWDSDDDGLSDYEEIMIYGTNPNDTDTDDDLAGEDIGDDKGFFECRVPTSGLALPGHPANECASSQGETRIYCEGEGCIRCMSDCEEVLSHAGVWPFQFPRDQSDPLNPDTDADGLRDDDEFPPGCNCGGPRPGKDGFVNNADSDDDGLQDGADAALSLYDVLGAGADFVVEGIPYSVSANDGELFDEDICAICDTDSDGDGLSDGEELHIGTDPLDWDTDDDGLSDREEIEFFATDPFVFDTDGDKAGSPSEGEGIDLIDARNPDIVPALLGYGGFRGVACESDCEEILSRGTHPPFVGDPRDQTDPRQVDTDGDGLEDWKEFYPGCGNLESPTPLADGYANSFDSDSDGLPDGEEINNSLGGADVGEAGVGMALGNDGELSNSPPGTQDLICSMCDPDSDDDGLKDGEEDYNVEQHLDWDFDDDGLSDREEAEVFYTDPFVQDTDGDGANGNIGCRTASESPLLIGYIQDTCIDCRSDCEEALSGSEQGLFMGDTRDQTDPLAPDTDGDGLTDDVEFAPGCGCRLAHEHVPEGIEEYRDVGSNIRDGYAGSFDSDADGKPDGLDVYEDLIFAWVPFPGEVRTTVIPGTGDFEEQEKDRYELPEVGPPPADANCIAPCSICDPDSDGDGLTDGEENDIGASWLDWDTDDDGGNDGLESTGSGPIPTDPFDPDTDDDGLLDSAEVLGPNPTNPVNADTDGDGLCDGGGPTFTPSGTGTNPLCSCTTPPCESVGGILDHPNPSGLGEDQDGDGSWDAGETDPNQYDTDGDAVGDGVEKLGFSTSRQSWIPINDLFGRAITVTYPACGCSDPLDPDTDDDGLDDGYEDLNHDGNFDFLVSDFDYEDPLPGPTRPEPEETNPCDADTDDDGLIDYLERYQPNPPSFFPFNPTNPLDHDTDNDRLTDGVEVYWTCINPGYDLDPDRDGVDDYYVMGTIDNVLDPTNRDSDSDSYIDGLDTNPCYSFIIPILAPPIGPPVDTDGDGFTDAEELAAGTDPSDETSHPAAFTADLDRDGEENDRLWLGDYLDDDGIADAVALDIGSDVLVDARIKFTRSQSVTTGDYDGDGLEDDVRYEIVYALANAQFRHPRIELTITDLDSDLTIDGLEFGQ